jgi:hypothetical protein
VLVGRVVRHHVDDDAQAELVGAGDEGVGVREGAEERVDVAVVGDVVTCVGLRRCVEGREPDRVDAEPAEVVQVRRDAGQVADAVAVAVGPRPGVDLVDHRVAPPGRVRTVGHMQRRRRLVHVRRFLDGREGGRGKGRCCGSSHEPPSFPIRRKNQNAF